MCAKFLKLYPALCDPMDCSPPYSIHGTLQAKILEWVVMPSSRESCQPRDRTLLLVCLMNWFNSAQFSSVQSLSHDRLCDPIDCSMLGLPVHQQCQVFTQTHVHWVGDAIQPSRPLSSPSPPALNFSQHQGLFQWVSSSHQVAKGQHQSFQRILRTDFL